MPLTCDRVQEFDEISSQDGGGDGIDKSGQNLGNFIPKEVVRKMSNSNLNEPSKLSLRTIPMF
jgi:hypothetical protein